MGRRLGIWIEGDMDGLGGEGGTEAEAKVEEGLSVAGPDGGRAMIIPVSQVLNLVPLARGSSHLL
jgi:hypothetical protein